MKGPSKSTSSLAWTDWCRPSVSTPPRARARHTQPHALLLLLAPPSTPCPACTTSTGGFQVILCHFLAELGLNLGLALAFVIIVCFYLFKTVQEGHSPLPPNTIRNLAFYLFGWVWIAWTISHCQAIYHTSRTSPTACVAAVLFHGLMASVSQLMAAAFW